jgi:hypothetical protein
MKRHRNTKAPMPDVVVSRSSTSSASSVVLPPSVAFQAPMRILKRPSSQSPATSSSSLDNSTRETLAQREVRYQAARERIFREGRTEPVTDSKDGVYSEAIPTATLIRNPRGPADSHEDGPIEGFGSRRTAKGPPVPPETTFTSTVHETRGV